MIHNICSSPPTPSAVCMVYTAHNLSKCPLSSVSSSNSMRFLILHSHEVCYPQFYNWHKKSSKIINVNVIPAIFQNLSVKSCMVYPQVHIMSLWHPDFISDLGPYAYLSLILSNPFCCSVSISKSSKNGEKSLCLVYSRTLAWHTHGIMLIWQFVQPLYHLAVLLINKSYPAGSFLAWLQL